MISIWKPFSRVTGARFQDASAMQRRHSRLASMSCTQFHRALSSGRQSSRLCTLWVLCEAVSTSTTGQALLRFPLPITEQERSLKSIALDFLKPRLMQSRTPVVVPFDHGILFVSSFHCAKFPRRRSEITEPLDAISGIQFRLRRRRLDERGLSCTV
jgi:hypothetical protein